MVHKTGFNGATQVMMLLLSIMLAHNTVSVRFYRALYSKLLSPELLTTSKQSMFLNVVYRAMKHDSDMCRVRAFVKRLIQVASSGPAALASGILVLVSVVMRDHRILFKMVRDDNEESRGKILIRNQETGDDEFEETENVESDCDDSVEPMDTGIQLLVHGDKVVEVQPEAKVEEELDTQDTKEYDPTNRDPRFAGCSSDLRLWEIDALLKHYHPTVRVFTTQLLSNFRKGIQYSGNPIRDLSNNAFLDRFVYRNPRKKDIENLKASKSTSKIPSVFGKHGRVGRMGTKVAAQAVNSARFLLKDKSQVQAEDRFFHDFFHKKALNEGKDLSGELSEKLLDRNNHESDPFLRDDEAEFDEVAGKLANDMMRATHGNPDIDDADVDIDFDYEDDNPNSEGAIVEDSEMFDDNDSDSDQDSTNFDGNHDDEDSDIMDEIESEEDGLFEDDELEPESSAKSPSNLSDVDQISDMFETSGKDLRNKKQRDWEDRISRSDSRDRRKRVKKRKL